MALKFNHKPGMVAYITTGDPDVETSLKIAIAAIDAGADVIELGVPFSDPLADGPVIQRASERAVARHTRMADVLRVAKEIRAARADAGLVIFTYLNPILRYGLSQFVDDAEAAGADGVLVIDLIVEEAGEYLAEMERAGLAPIFLAAPTSPDERIEAIAAACKGIYLRDFARGNHGQAAEPDGRCRGAGEPDSAMEQAAGGRRIRHLQRGACCAGGGVCGCGGGRQRDCGVDRAVDSRSSARGCCSIYQGSAPAPSGVDPVENSFAAI